MRPPRAVRRLLGWATPDHRRDEVLGDLEEVYGRRRAKRGAIWAGLASTVEAVGLAGAFLVYRARRRAESGLFTASEVRLALRLVGKSPLLSLTAFIALTTGVTLAATGFTVTAAFLGQELPFAAGPRVVEIAVRDATTGEVVSLPPALARDWGSIATDVRLERFGVVSTGDLNLSHGSGEVEPIVAARLTAGGFDYVPFEPLVGRFLTAADALEGRSAVVVVGESLWTRRFAADPDLVGTTIQLAGVPHTVVGVVPDIGFPAAADVLLPLSLVRADHAAAVAAGRVLGLLSEGGTAEQAVSAMQARAAADGGVGYAGPEVRVDGHRVEDPPGVGGIGSLVVGLLIGLLLVIAGNVGNLMAARAFGRREELAVRAALGADRVRLVTQLSLESLTLTAASVLAGLAISQRLLTWFIESEGEIPPWIDMGVDVTTVLFVVFVTSAITVVAGVAPAARATQVRGEGLRAAASAVAGARFGWVHDGMIVAQIALAVGILGASSTVNRAWSQGFDGERLGGVADSILAVEVTLPDGSEAAGRARETLSQAVAALPGVQSVGVANHTPGVDAPSALIRVDGDDTGPRRVPVARVDAPFFEVLGVEAVQGRILDEPDFAVGAVPVALVNQPFVRDHLGGANAVGRRVRLAGTDDQVERWFEVVGVVPDLGLSGTDPTRAAGVYLPMAAAGVFDLLVRTPDTSPQAMQAVRAVAFAVDPDISLQQVWVLDDLIRRVRRIFLGIGSTFATLGVIVLLLSLLGIYSILAFEVSRRTREIGVRVALGARAADVMRPVLTRVAGYVATGGFVGLLLGIALGKMVQGMVLLRVPETGVGTLTALVGIVLVASLASAVVPTLRALAVEPASALRAE